MKEYTGKSIDEIINKIADEQKIDPSQIKYRVIEEKNGFLGIGKNITIQAYSENDILVFIKEYLTNVLSNANIESEITISTNKDSIEIDLAVSDQVSPVLIGKNGANLLALNNVLKKAVEVEFHKHLMILVDVNGYKHQKYQKLEHLCQKYAKEVLATKASILLDPMPADERKLIHRYLNKVDHISTKSEGEGRDRRLRISYEK